VHGAVADDVVHVALQQHVGVQGDVDLGEGGSDVFLGVQVDSAQRLLDLLGARVGQVDVAPVGVGGVVDPGSHVADQRDDLQRGCSRCVVPPAPAGPAPRRP
jgi:hypothetical protein